MPTSDPGAGADDQHVVERTAVAVRVRRPVDDRGPVELPVRAGHRLMGHAVDRDLHALAVLRVGLGLRGHLVVRRPGDARRHRLHEQGRDHHAAGRHGQPPAATGDHQGETDRHQRAPDDRGRPDERQRGEEADPDQGAHEVPAVRRERLQLSEAAPHDFGRPGQHGRCQREDDRQDHPGRRSGGLERGEEDQVGAGAVDGDREDPHADHEQGEQHRRVGQDRPGLSRDQEAQPDAEERPQQHEVGEVRQVDDVGPQPADQRQLQEQHQRTAEDQPQHDGSAAVVPGRALELVLLHRRVHRACPSSLLAPPGYPWA